MMSQISKLKHSLDLENFNRFEIRVSQIGKWSQPTGLVEPNKRLKANSHN